LRGGEYKYLFPHWPDKLDAVFSYSECAFANFGSWAASVSRLGFDDSAMRHEPPSRLIAVPKTYSGPRLIASEPVAHQWCQQTIRDFFVSRVADTSLGLCISFRDQTPNQVAALKASATRASSTIDCRVRPIVSPAGSSSAFLGARRLCCLPCTRCVLGG
jgi:hypothetical protein